MGNLIHFVISNINKVPLRHYTQKGAKTITRNENGALTVGVLQAVTGVTFRGAVKLTVKKIVKIRFVFT